MITKSLSFTLSVPSTPPLDSLLEDRTALVGQAKLFRSDLYNEIEEIFGKKVHNRNTIKETKYNEWMKTSTCGFPTPGQHGDCRTMEAPTKRIVSRDVSAAHCQKNPVKSFGEFSGWLWRGDIRDCLACSCYLPPKGN